MVRQLPSGTLILITGGQYTGYIGRIDYYTSRRVRFYLVEDALHRPVQAPAATLTSFGHITRLDEGHPRAAHFPELHTSFLMRQAVIQLVTAFAIETDDFESTVQSLMDDILTQWAYQE
jgi:hypothetical protein